MNKRIWALLTIFSVVFTGCKAAELNYSDDVLAEKETEKDITGEQEFTPEEWTLNIYITKENEDGTYEAYDEERSYQLFPSEDLSEEEKELLLEGTSLVVQAKPFSIIDGVNNQILDPREAEIDFLPMTIQKADVMDETTKAKFVPVYEEEG